MEKSSIKPMMVQNRCYGNRGWNREVRAICRKHGIVYQVLFRFVIQVGHYGNNQ